MTAPRIPLFQRKGPPAPDIDMPPIDATSDAGMPATCPSCGCTFDPASGEVIPSPDAPPAGPPDQPDNPMGM